jgi:hypothetical protein
MIYSIQAMSTSFQLLPDYLPHIGGQMLGVSYVD